MNAHVAFFLGAPDGIPGHFLRAPLGEFSEWFEETLAAEELDADPGIATLIERARTSGARALRVASTEEAERVDRMLDEFYGSFCDHVRPDLLHPATPSALYLARYEKLGQSLSGEARVLWGFLENGRGVGREAEIYPYSSDDGVFRLGYWTGPEVATVLTAIQAVSRPRPLSREHAALVAILEALEFAEAEKVGLITVVA